MAASSSFSINLYGPTGPQGPAGNPGGPTGPTGPAGAQGAPGTAANQGATGPTGPAGTNGSNGANGTAGSIGPTGYTGYTGQPAPQNRVITLTDGATINTDASLLEIADVTLGGNRILGNPTNPTNGKSIRWRIKQDGTGSRTLTFGSKFRFGTDLPSIVLSTTPGKTDVMGATYNLADDKWDVLAFIK